MSRFKHGYRPAGKRNKTYLAWQNMNGRCFNPALPNYHNYGGRGITVCERWRDFANFLADMGECPPGLTLERNNNQGDYEPGNCTWASYDAQGNNRRTNRLIECNGVTKTLSQWSRATGLHKDTIRWRLRTMAPERALSYPSGRA